MGEKEERITFSLMTHNNHYRFSVFCSFTSFSYSSYSCYFENNMVRRVFNLLGFTEEGFQTSLCVKSQKIFSVVVINYLTIIRCQNVVETKQRTLRSKELSVSSQWLA